MTDRPRVYRRDPWLVLSVLELLEDRGELVDWLEVVDRFSTPELPSKAVENVLYDLDAFGAIHRVGKAGHRSRGAERAVKLTELGAAWLKGTRLPLPGQL